MHRPLKSCADVSEEGQPSEAGVGQGHAGPHRVPHRGRVWAPTMSSPSFASHVRHDTNLITWQASDYSKL